MNKYPTIWGGGQLIAFSGLEGATDFDNMLCLRTSETKYEFELKECNQWFKEPDFIRYSGKEPDKIEVTGDFFRFYTGNKVSCGVLVDAKNLLLQGDFTVTLTDKFENIKQGDKQLVARQGQLNKALIELDAVAVSQKLGRWLQNQKLPETLSATSRQAAVKALSQLKTQICTPQGLLKHLWSTPDRWPHGRIWLWDSVFHALGMRHYNIEVARQMVEAVFDLQQPDGFIPLCGSPVGIQEDFTQPPVLGLALKKLHETEPAPEWLARLAPKLARYIDWVLSHRDKDGAGLVEWKVTGDPLCHSGESGMDNSPRFDQAMKIDATDFNSYLAFECEFLADLLPEQRNYWRGHYERLCRLIRERLWCEELNFFVDYDIVEDEQKKVMASSGFLPLYCGAATPEQAAKLAAHLTNPETFGTPLRVASIARCHSKEYQKDMWRGPVWINVNYLIALGLERYGFHELARDIIQKTCQEEEKWFLEYGTFFEFYDDRHEHSPLELDRKGKGQGSEDSVVHHPFADYGWSATLYLEMINHPEWR